jgi:hypothetical protein
MIATSKALFTCCRLFSKSALVTLRPALRVCPALASARDRLLRQDRRFGGCGPTSLKELAACGPTAGPTAGGPPTAWLAPAAMVLGELRPGGDLLIFKDLDLGLERLGEGPCDLCLDPGQRGPPAGAGLAGTSPPPGFRRSARKGPVSLARKRPQARPRSPRCFR